MSMEIGVQRTPFRGKRWVLHSTRGYGQHSGLLGRAAAMAEQLTGSSRPAACYRAPGLHKQLDKRSERQRLLLCSPLELLQW